MVQSNHKSGSASSMGGEAKLVLGFSELPGFRCAKLSKEMKEIVEKAVEWYIDWRRG